MAEESKEIIHKEIPEEEVKVKPLRQEEKGLKIIVIGKVGVGKSQLINSLLGEKKAKVTQHTQNYSDCAVIEEYKGKILETEVVIYDTIGFGAGDNDKKLMKELEKKLRSSDGPFILLICQKFQSRLDDAFWNFAKLLAKHFAGDYRVWKNSIFVLTQANKFNPAEDEKDEEEIDPMTGNLIQWGKRFKECLESNGVKEKIIMNMPVCPAGTRKKKKLPITDNWIETLLAYCKECQHKQMIYNEMETESESVGKKVGGIVGGVAGGVIIPVIGAPFGFKIGQLIGMKMGKEYCRKKIIEIETEKKLKTQEKK